MNANEILDEMEEIFPDAKCELYHESPFQLIVAVVLSAQTTDAMVNKVTPALFMAYPTAEKMAEATVSELEPYIKKIGLYRNKARSISNLSKDLVERYHGQVPYTYKDLMSLAGVGRKTANVVRGEIWGLADGITVDTHVKRLSNLIGLTKNDDPIKIEQDLMKIVPRDSWIDFSHYLILQGRDKCIARRPKCQECEISGYCTYGKKKLINS